MGVCIILCVVGQIHLLEGHVAVCLFVQHIWIVVRSLLNTVDCYCFWASSFIHAQHLYININIHVYTHRSVAQLNTWLTALGWSTTLARRAATSSTCCILIILDGCLYWCVRESVYVSVCLIYTYPKNAHIFKILYIIFYTHILHTVSVVSWSPWAGRGRGRSRLRRSKNQSR